MLRRSRASRHRAAAGRDGHHRAPRRRDAPWTASRRAIVAADGTFLAALAPNASARPRRARCRAPTRRRRRRRGRRARRSPSTAAMATWYGPGFYGRKTACGQRLTRRLLGVAHRRCRAARGRALLPGPRDRRPGGRPRPVPARLPWDLTAATAQALGFTTDRIGAVRRAQLPARPGPRPVMNLLNRPRARRIANAVIADPEEAHVDGRARRRALDPGRRPRRPRAASSTRSGRRCTSSASRARTGGTSRASRSASSASTTPTTERCVVLLAPAVRAAALPGARVRDGRRPRHRALADPRRRARRARAATATATWRSTSAAPAEPSRATRGARRGRGRELLPARSRTWIARWFYGHPVAHPRARHPRLPALAGAARPRGVGRRALRRRRREAQQRAGHRRRHAVAVVIALARRVRRVARAPRPVRLIRQRSR